MLSFINNSRRIYYNSIYVVWNDYQKIKTVPLQQHLQDVTLHNLIKAHTVYQQLKTVILSDEAQTNRSMLSITLQDIATEATKYKLQKTSSVLFFVRTTQNLSDSQKNNELEKNALLECTDFVKNLENPIEVRIGFIIEMIEHSFRLSQINLEILKNYRQLLDDLIKTVTQDYVTYKTGLQHFIYMIDIKIIQATLDKACIEEDTNYTITIPELPSEYSAFITFLENYNEIVKLDLQKTSQASFTNRIKNLTNYVEKIVEEQGKKTLTNDVSMSIVYACLYSVKRFKTLISLDELIIILQNYFQKQPDPYFAFCIAYCGANLGPSPDIKKLLYFMEHMNFFINKKMYNNTILEKYMRQTLERFAHFILERSPYNKGLYPICTQWIKNDALSSIEKTKLDNVKNKLFLAQTFEQWHSNQQSYQNIVDCLTNTFQKSKKHLIPASVRQNMLTLCSQSADNILVDQFETVETWFNIQKKIAQYLNNDTFHIKKLYAIVDEELSAHEKSGGFNNDRLTALLALLKKIDNKDIENASVYYHKVKAALGDQC